MLLTLGYVLAGVIIYDYLTSERSCVLCELAKETMKSCVCSDTNVVYHVKSGEGEISLPPCRLIGVELGPSADPDKATLQIMMNKSVEAEYKPVTDIRKKKYVNIKPIQYHMNVVLKTKKKGKVPITAYYNSVS